MKFLLDTHLLVWLVSQSSRLPAAARRLIEDPANVIYFSVVTIWEIAIKAGKERADFNIDPEEFRLTLLQAGYKEVAVLGVHANAVRHLPQIHRDPFDRMLVAQAQVENITLLTVDQLLAQYPGPILKM